MPSGHCPVPSRDDFVKATAQSDVVAWFAFKGSGAIASLIEIAARELSKDETIHVVYGTEGPDAYHEFARAIEAKLGGAAAARVDLMDPGACIEDYDERPPGRVLLLNRVPAFSEPPERRRLVPKTYYASSAVLDRSRTGTIAVGADRVVAAFNEVA